MFMSFKHYFKDKTNCYTVRFQMRFQPALIIWHLAHLYTVNQFKYCYIITYIKINKQIINFINIDKIMPKSQKLIASESLLVYNI